MIASLPMYDWPEVREATDALWVALRDTIRARGIDAPDTLDRTRAASDVWTDPALVFSQTCGMPWRLGLHTKAALVGTPDFGVEGCPPGYYRSALVIRADDRRDTLAAFAPATCAFNSADSQSGFAAWEGAPFGVWKETGAHANSIRAVASGEADIAAIDAVTWRLAQRYLPEAKTLRVLAKTRPTPGLPYITGHRQDADAIAEAVSEVNAHLDRQIREELGIVGFTRIPSEQYLAIA